MGARIFLSKELWVYSKSSEDRAQPLSSPLLTAMLLRTQTSCKLRMRWRLQSQTAATDDARDVPPCLEEWPSKVAEGPSILSAYHILFVTNLLIEFPKICLCNCWGCCV